MSRALSEAVLAPVSSLAATSRSISARRAYSLRPYTVFSAAWPTAGNKNRLSNSRRGVSLINPGAVLCGVRVKATGSTAQASSFICHHHKMMTSPLFMPCVGRGILSRWCAGASGCTQTTAGTLKFVLRRLSTMLILSLTIHAGLASFALIDL
ncbi:hypothetical protein D3C84_979940 [compost metagenome]